MSWTDIFGNIACMFSFASAIGILHQVLKIKKRQTAGDISRFSVLVGMGAWLFWALYGLTVGKWYLFTPQTLAFFFSVVLLWQTYKYK